jgi:16S rRNA (cytosine1402-N4)-methyltransferase
MPASEGSPATFRVLTKRPVGPTETEVAHNPRARSATLRAGERTDAAVGNADDPPLPTLPSFDEIMRGGRR